MKKVAALLALALAAFALVACGGDDETAPTTTNNAPAEETGSDGGQTEGGGGGNAAETLTFETPSGAELAYTTDEAEAKAGKVTVELDNVQAVPHDVAFEEASGETIGQTELITDSSTSTVVDFKPGAYTFYCSVPGHREAGMEGTLTVE